MARKPLEGPCEAAVGAESHEKTSSVCVFLCQKPGKCYNLTSNLPGGAFLCDEHVAHFADMIDGYA